VCRFLSLDFAMDLKCPVDRANHRVRFQSYPSLGLHPLDVVECDAKPFNEQLTCGKLCRELIESGEYWLTTYPESANIVADQ
jgi:hypothetical protein